MRVISGIAGSLILKTPRGNFTRPTTDKVKETLFNMIANHLYDATFLDMFAGSGGIGIEALSRGAKKAYFCDIDREAVECIKYNLLHTKLSDRAVVLKGGFESNLEKLKSLGEKFDIVFLDPPYQKGFEDKCLDILLNSTLIDEYTLIIIEEDFKTDTAHLEKDWDIIKVKEYKSNKHIFIHKRG